MGQCWESGRTHWLFGLALDLGVLALFSAVMWAAVWREARPAGHLGARPRRSSRLREWLRRTVGLAASALLLAHWLLGFSHVGSARFAVLGGAGLAVLLPVVAVIRLAAVARRQRPTAATPLPWAQVQDPIRWALPALVALGALGSATTVITMAALGRSC